MQNYRKTIAWLSQARVCSSFVQRIDDFWIVIVEGQKEREGREYRQQAVSRGKKGVSKGGGGEVADATTAVTIGLWKAWNKMYKKIQQRNVK